MEQPGKVKCNVVLKVVDGTDCFERNKPDAEARLQIPLLSCSHYTGKRCLPLHIPVCPGVYPCLCQTYGPCLLHAQHCRHLLCLAWGGQSFIEGAEHLHTNLLLLLPWIPNNSFTLRVLLFSTTRLDATPIRHSSHPLQTFFAPHQRSHLPGKPTTEPLHSLPPPFDDPSPIHLIFSYSLITYRQDVVESPRA